MEKDNDIKRLAITRKYGQRLQIGDASVYVEVKGANCVTVYIDAPLSVVVKRDELLEKSLFPIEG